MITQVLNRHTHALQQLTRVPHSTHFRLIQNERGRDIAHSEVIQNYLFE